MDERTQFTFYRSYWDAIEELPAKAQLPILKAIIRYALFGEEPSSLSSVCRAVFLLVKPTLDASRKKAANGKQGGSKKKANSKQKSNEKENEEEKENENELEGEIDKKQAPLLEGKAFTSFWEAYPWKMNREEAWEAWKTLNPDYNTAIKIMTGLEAWKKSERWTEQNGRFIPGAAKFLREREAYWGNPPAPAAAKPQQGYVHGADRLLMMLERGDFDD